MTSEIDTEVLQRWKLTPMSVVGQGSHNNHWPVQTRQGNECILRRYKKDHFPDIAYEFEVMHRLRGMGWPVPVLEEAPIELSGCTWCLMAKLPGASNLVRDSQEQRRRGRLLAELHQSTRDLADLGQRNGFVLSDALVGAPSLVAAIRRYEKAKPDIGYILRWHIERSIEVFTTLDHAASEKLVLHSDLISVNLLYDDSELTGILDFEATHLNYRVADFALSWRGRDDDVISGYEEVERLSDLDWQMLVPTFWSWLFIGVEKVIERTSEDQFHKLDFSWQVKLLSRRSKLFGDLEEAGPSY